jgi:hypothetical protein
VRPDEEAVVDRGEVELATMPSAAEAGPKDPTDAAATGKDLTDAAAAGKDLTDAAASGVGDTKEEDGMLAKIWTVEFWALMLFMTQNFLRFNMYLGSLDAQLAAISSSTDEKVGLLQAFGVILPVGALTVIIAGQTVDRLGITASCVVLSVLGVLVNGLAMIPVAQAQYATFLCFATFRAFLFTFLSNYVAQRYGFGLVGRMLGVISLLGGLVSFLQYPLLSVALAQEPVSFDIPNGLMLGIGVVSLAYPAYVAAIHGAMMPGSQD